MNDEQMGISGDRYGMSEGQANPVGRPSGYTQEIADQICERIAEGESLRSICSGYNMPAKSAVFRWLSERPEFKDQYAHARSAQAEGYAEEIVSIADLGETERIRVQVDARKWVVSKLLPKVYGDRQVLEHAGSLNITNLTDEEIAAKLAAHGVDVGPSGAD